MADNKKTMFYILSAIIVTIFLAYIFGKFQVLPDVAIAGPAFASLLMLIDDAVAVILGVFAIRRLKINLIDKKKSDKKTSILGIILMIIIVIAALWYIFLGADLLNDSLPYIGWFDDAIAGISVIWIAGKIRRKFTHKE
jgi:hypothetical protein